MARPMAVCDDRRPTSTAALSLEAIAAVGSVARSSASVRICVVTRYLYRAIGKDRVTVPLMDPLVRPAITDEIAGMNELLIGYARVSTYEQDLTAQRNALVKLGVDDRNIYTDHGLTGTNRERPGLRIALAACREGDTLVVAKLDRLSRSLRDASDIVDELTAKGVKLNIGGSVHDPCRPGRSTAVQRSGDGGRVRVRPHSFSDS